MPSINEETSLKNKYFTLRIPKPQSSEPDQVMTLFALTAVGLA
jgi:hypothetical protein